jgi:hypothetical protein
MKFSIELLRRRYEAWIIYFISRGNLQDIENFAHDLTVVYQIDLFDVLKVFNWCKSEVSIRVALGVEFNRDFKAFITVEYLDSKEVDVAGVERIGNRKWLIGQTFDHKKDYSEKCGDLGDDGLLTAHNKNIFNDNLKNNLDTCKTDLKNFSLSASGLFNDADIEPVKLNLEFGKSADVDEDMIFFDESQSYQSEIPGPSQYRIDYYFICDDQQPSPEKEKLDYSSLPTITPNLITHCTDQTCSNQTFCRCSHFTNSQIGLQRTLIVHKGVKRIPRTWKDEYYLFECHDSCNCNKNLCSLTFFSPSQKTFSRVLHKEGQCKASKNLMRGEFVLEVFGKLSEKAYEKGIQVAEKIFMDLEKSNIKKIADEKPGNLIPVRIFSFVDLRVICRLALFTSQAVLKGEAISLDFSRLEKLIESSEGNN